MRVAIQDSEVLSRVRLSDIAGYLRTRGWILAGEYGSKASRWALTSGDLVAETIVPRSAEVVDFPDRVSDILRVLAAVEDRSQAEVLSDIYTSSADVLRIRLEATDDRDGSISLAAGRRLVDNVEELLHATAASAVRPRAYYPRRKPAEVYEWLKSVRLGQTERGSYVVTIISKVPPTLFTLEPSPPPVTLENDVHAPSVDGPFGRQAMVTTARALGRLKSAAESAVSTGRYDDFLHGVPVGVSANLCDALVGIGEDEVFRSVGFSFTWAMTRPSVSVEPRVSIPSEWLPTIQEAGRILKEREPPEQQSIEGWVVHLERERADQPAGLIRVAFPIEGKMRQAEVTLQRDNYQKAIDAHKAGTVVHCAGSLRRGGRGYVLAEPHDFRPLPDVQEPREY